MAVSTYLEYYYTYIAPVYREVDVLMKSGRRSLSAAEAARSLRVPAEEVRRAMRARGIKVITPADFFAVMRECSSEACRLYKREVDAGSPHVYTKEDVSYIYGLDRAVIDAACRRLGIIEMTAYTLPDVFAEIKVKVAD